MLAAEMDLQEYQERFLAGKVETADEAEMLGVLGEDWARDQAILTLRRHAAQNVLEGESLRAEVGRLKSEVRRHVQGTPAYERAAATWYALSARMTALLGSQTTLIGSCDPSIEDAIRDCSGRQEALKRQRARLEEQTHRDERMAKLRKELKDASDPRVPSPLCYGSVREHREDLIRQLRQWAKVDVGAVLKSIEGIDRELQSLARQRDELERSRLTPEAMKFHWQKGPADRPGR